MSSYRLIAFDMDGTLLDSNKKITPKTKEAIIKAFESGKEVIISTGRGIAELREYLEFIPEIRYVISMSGALVYDFHAKKVIFENSISEDEVRVIFEETMKRDTMNQLLTEDKSLVEASKEENLGRYGMQEYQSLYDECSTKVNNIREYYENFRPTVYKMNNYHTSFEESVELMTALRERNAKGDLHVELTFSERTSVECARINTTKGTGLIKLCEYLGIELSETIAVGDANNDLDILSKAGLSVAMGNAKDSVKKLANVITSDNDHDGCAEVIQKYLL